MSRRSVGGWRSVGVAHHVVTESLSDNLLTNASVTIVVTYRVADTYKCRQHGHHYVPH